MASQSQNLSGVNATLAGINRQASALNQSSSSISRQWVGFQGVIKAVQGSTVGTLLGFTMMGKAIQNAANIAEEMTATGKKDVSFLNHKVAKLEEYQQKGIITNRQAKELLKLREALAQVTWHNNKLDELSAIYGRSNLAVAGLLLNASRTSIKYSRELNDSIKSANHDYSFRAQIMEKTLEVQSETGRSNEAMVSAVRDLVSYGLQNKSNFGEILELTVKLEEGLGLSTKTAGELAMVWERRVNDSFKNSGDMLAKVVENTGLAADEAARFAIEIGRAFASVGMTGREITEAAGAMARLEGLIKRQGGKEGEVSGLMKKIATGSRDSYRTLGFMGGSFNPGSYAGKGGQEAFMKQLGGTINHYLSGVQKGSMEYSIMLEMLSENLQISQDNILAVADAVKEYNTQSTKSLSIEEAWQKQVAAASRSWSRLTTAFKALVYEGLMPVVAGAGWLSEQLVGVLKYVKFLAPVFKVVLPIALVAAAVKTVSLAAAVWSWVTSLKAAQVQLAATNGATGGVVQRVKGMFDVFNTSRAGGTTVADSLKKAVPAINKFGDAAFTMSKTSNLRALAAVGVGPGMIGAAVIGSAALGVAAGVIFRKLVPDTDAAVQKLFGKMLNPSTTARQSATVAHETFQNRLWKDLDPKKGNVASIAADINRAVEMEAGRGASGFQLNRMRQEAAETLMTEANRRKTRMALGGKEDVNEIKRLQELAAAQLKAVEESSRIAAEQGQAQRQSDRAKEEREAAEARMRMVPVGGGAYGFSYTQQYSPR